LRRGVYWRLLYWWAVVRWLVFNTYRLGVNYRRAKHWGLRLLLELCWRDSFARAFEEVYPTAEPGEGPTDVRELLVTGLQDLCTKHKAAGKQQTKRGSEDRPRRT